MKFSIPGEPQGKARARTVRTSGGVRTYTPDKTALYENLVVMCYKAEHPGAGQLPPDIPLEVTITARYAIPKSVSRKKRESMARGETLPCKRPDADNIAKVVCDALNGVAYHDDAQIARLSVAKCYDANPRVDVCISPIWAYGPDEVK